MNGASQQKLNSSITAGPTKISYLVNFLQQPERQNLADSGIHIC